MTITPRFSRLLFALLLMAVMNPLLEAFGLFRARIVLNICFTIVLIAGAYVTSKGGRVFYFVLPLAVASIICGLLDLAFNRKAFLLAFHACLGGFFLTMTVFLLSKVLKNERVTWEKISAALCVYMLSGYFWGSIYTIIEVLKPMSFSNSANGYPDLIYFSFVTLATVGFGDITPLSSLARSLCTLEAVSGQLYLAVLVARLVGLHIVHAEETHS